MMRRGLKSAAAIESDPAGLRLAVVRNEAPLALVVSGTVLILVSGAESLTAGPRNSESLISALVVALVTAGVASSIRWVPTLSSYAAALFAGNMTLIALWLLHLFVAATTIAHTGYLAVIILVLGSVSLAWGPFLASSAVVLTTALWMAQANDWGSDTAWPDTMLVSFVAGAMLLVARRRSLDELAKARSLAEQRATIDVLTGAFNRRGLEAMLPPMIGTAERLEQAIFVVFVDVDRLKLANDSFGHEFGDHVLRAVSESLQEVVREGDLVCRWGGDEFTVVGLGSEPDSEEFAQRVHTQLLNTGIDLHKWVGGLSFGSAHAAARAMSIDALIQIADSRMYESRRARREPSRWQTDPER